MIISCAYRAGAYQDCSLEGGGGALQTFLFSAHCINSFVNDHNIFVDKTGDFRHELCLH